MELYTTICTPDEMLKTNGKFISQQKQFFRNGILLEKGAVLTEKRIENNREVFEKYCEYWSVYPDMYLEMIKPTTSKFQLKFFQRIFLRACLRHGRVLTIAPRAAGKTFICVLALYLICIFRPGSHVNRGAVILRSVTEKISSKLEIPKLIVEQKKNLIHSFVCGESRNNLLFGLWLNPKVC